MFKVLYLRPHLLGLILMACLASSAHASSTFYVDAVYGSDSNSGLSPSSAFQTITRAQTAVRTVNSNMTADIYVYLASGVYTQTSTLTMTPADSGTNGYYVHYAASAGATPQISGGLPISGWTAVSGKPYWVATLPSTFPSGVYFRQLYVNGRRAILAGQTAPMQASSLIVNQSGQVQGANFTTSQVHTTYHNLTDVRLFHYESFKADYLPIVSMSVSGTTVSIYTQQPYTAFRGSRFFDAASNWVIQNDIEDLSQPGQWYLDQAARLVYYYPRAGESLTGSGAAQVVAPVVDTVLSVFGNGSQVTNLSFEGMTFEYGNWLVPQTSFFGGTQAEALFLPNLPVTATIEVTNPYMFQMPGEVTLNQTNNIHFLRDTFRHSADCGLDIYNAATNTLVQGNVTYDTTGAGIVLGQRYALYGSNSKDRWALSGT